MSTKNPPAYMVSGNVVRKGLSKIIVISITDGVDTWTFDTAETFTVPELEQRFPYFNKPAKRSKK